jgi:hypothetical protein
MLEVAFRSIDSLDSCTAPPANRLLRRRDISLLSQAQRTTTNINHSILQTSVSNFPSKLRFSVISSLYNTYTSEIIHSQN